jgi:hypothetical protein
VEQGEGLRRHSLADSHAVAVQGRRGTAAPATTMARARRRRPLGDHQSGSGPARGPTWRWPLDDHQSGSCPHKVPRGGGPSATTRAAASRRGPTQRRPLGDHQSGSVPARSHAAAPPSAMHHSGHRRQDLQTERGSPCLHRWLAMLPSTTVFQTCRVLLLFFFPSFLSS